MQSGKSSKISKRFIITVGLIYATLIIVMAAFFSIAANRGASILRDTLAQYGIHALLDKAEVVIDRLAAVKALRREDIAREIAASCTIEKDYLYAVVYGKTGDENYFRVLDTIAIKGDMNVPLQVNDTVREMQERNYIREAQLRGVVDPRLYAERGHVWQNVYYPFRLGNEDLVIQFMIATGAAGEALANYRASISDARTAALAISVILIVVVIAVTSIFIHNYSLLIDNLSLYIGKAAQGELDLSLNETDNELNKLALSFNSLMEELKDKKEKEEEKEAHGPERDLFLMGVSMLKENRLDDCIAVFRTLTILKPDSFGSYFNLGVAYAKRKEYANSLAMFERAMAENPSYDITRKYIEKIRKLMDTNGNT